MKTTLDPLAKIKQRLSAAEKAVRTTAKVSDEMTKKAIAEAHEKHMAAVSAYEVVKKEYDDAMVAVYRAKYPPLPPSAVTWSGVLKTDFVDGKRFTLDGITVSATCPTCGGQISCHAGDHLFSPSFGVPIWIQLWCEACCEADEEDEYQGHDAVIQLRLRVESPTEMPASDYGRAS